MKMFGFIFITLLIGAAIAAYIKIPKDDDTKFVINTIKFFIGIMVLSLFTIFVFASLGSTTSIKLF